MFFFSYFVYFYYWAGARHFSTLLGPSLYCVAPALGSVALLSALRLREAHRINFALVLISTAISAMSVEVVLTIWSSLPSVQRNTYRRGLREAAKKEGISFDAREKTEVLEDLRASGVDAFPSVYPQAFLVNQESHLITSPPSISLKDFLPLAGIANKTTLVCNEGGQYLTYVSDEHGFHNPKGLWESPADVVALGDSYTQGWCVPSESNFVALIRQRYPATVSLGIEGDGPLVMLATLREYAEVLKPRIVLWFYFEGNDLADLIRERRSPLLNRYLTEDFSQNLITRQAEIDRLVSAYVEAMHARENTAYVQEVWTTVTDTQKLSNGVRGIVRFSQLRGRLGLIQGISNDSDSPRDSQQVDSKRAEIMSDVVNSLEAILLEARNCVAGWGGDLYFVYLPSLNRFTPGPKPSDVDRSLVLHAANRVGLPVIDVQEAFEAQPDPLALFPLRQAAHYNVQGHRLVAEEVLRAISSSQ
jgi:hypothetical protein